MGNAPSVSFADRELGTAAEKGNLARVKFLVEKDGANVNFQDAYGWSPVLHAVSEGHLDVVKFLLSKGATTTHITHDRANAIHHAVTSQNESMLMFLLQYGTCDVNAKNDGGWTPLHLACLSNNYQIVKLLLAFKADVQLENGEGKLASDITTSSNIRTLLERGPSPRGQIEEISPEEELYRNKGMQQSLQKLQTLQNQPKAPVEMKGYISLHENPDDSSDELISITTDSNNNSNSSNSNNNSNNNNNNNNYNYNNNNNNYSNGNGSNISSSSSSSNNTSMSRSSSRNRVDKPMTGEGLLERETQRILEAINLLRGIDPDNLNMMQVQELLDFHHSEMLKYQQARKIMEEIRAKELELLLTE